MRSKGCAIWSFLPPHQLGLHPHSLGWNGIPFGASSVLPRIAKLSKNPGATAIHRELLGSDEIAHRQFKAVIVCEVDGKRAISNEVIDPAEKVLPVDRKPISLYARIDCHHFVGGQIDGHARSKGSGREEEHAVGVVYRSVIGSQLIEL